MGGFSRFEREFFSPEVDTCGFEYRTSATNENVRGNA